MLSFVENDEWEKCIPYFSFAYNTTPHIDTGYSPYELIFVKLAKLPTDKINVNKTIYNLDDYVNKFKARIEFSLDKANKLLNVAKQRRKIYYDNNKNLSNFKVNDFVLIKYESRKKNVSPYHGPYKIIETKQEKST